MRLFAPATVVATLLLIATQGATALGLGRVNTLSHLGSALEFTVGLSAEAGDQLAPECIHADVYAGDTRVPPQMVRVRINRGADGVPTSLRVVTGTRIDEPVATVQLRLDCGTRLTRNYTVFIDPPVLNLAASEAPSTPFAAAPVPPAPRAQGPSTTRRASRPTAREPGQVQAGGTGSTGSAARQRRAEQAAAARAARAAARAEARNEQGSRLRLESAPPVSGAAPVRERRAGASPSTSGAASAAAGATASLARPPVAAAASAAPTTTAAASAASAAGSAAGLGGLIGELAARAESDALALQAEQLRALEKRVADVSRQNQSMQRTVAELQARLAEAEANRYANPLVYALLGLLVLLLAAIAALLWRQRHLRQESDWLKAASAEAGGEPKPAPEPRSIVRPSTQAPAPVARTAAAAAASAGLGGAETVSGIRARSAAESPSAAAVVDPPPAVVAPVAAPLAAAAVAAARVPHESTSVHDPRREVTVEELIDLEQQADFFVVLGQDDAAIDLLMGHVQGTGGASPLAYLKLLEIHRRRDDRVAYDRIRERFDRRFGANAPAWDSASGHDRSLDDYPAVVGRLQALWPRPVDAMEALSGLLFQRDAGSETFDLTAYGELLFLYSLARELSETEPPPDGVDLLLPLDDGPSSGGSGGAGGAPGAGLPRVSPGGAAALGAAGAVAGGAALTADPQRLADLDVGLSLAPQDDAPTLPLLPDLGTTYPAPLGVASPDEPLPDLNLDEGLLDLNISDEPEEPKGPLSKY